LSGYAAVIVLGLMLLLAGTVGAYVNAYMTTYALTTLHMAATVAFGIVIVKGVIQLPVTLIAGWLADRFGRKPVMLIPGVLLFASIVPMFHLIVDRHSATMLYLGAIELAILASFTAPPALVTISESLPRHIRSGTI